MDIDLLAKMVKNLILDNDRVVLPGLGCFVAEVAPSTFSDKGYTINPPYRRLYFRSKPDEGNELVEFYAETNNLPKALAETVIRDFLSDMKEVLFIKKTVVFPGLGRLRATKENDIFFVADEDLDIYPAGFGLEPVSLKTHQETQEEVTEAVAGLKSILDAPAEASAPTPEPASTPEPAPAPVSAPAPEVAHAPEPEVEPQPVPSPTQAPEPQPVEVQEPTVQPQPVATPVQVQEPAPQPVHQPQKAYVSYSQMAAAQKTERDWKRWFDEKYSVVKSNACRAWSWLMDPRRRLAVLIIGGILAAVLLFFVFFLLLANLFPNWMDTLLYSKEELEILNHTI